MLIKLQAIWRIVWSSEFLVVGDSGVTASYHKTNNHELIKTISEQINKIIEERNKL